MPQAGQKRLRCKARAGRSFDCAQDRLAKRTSGVRGARRASSPFDDAQGDRSVTSDDNDSPFVLSLVEA
jgi:hypothetical protein